MPFYLNNFQKLILRFSRVSKYFAQYLALLKKPRNFEWEKKPSVQWDLLQNTRKADKTRGFQCLLLCAILYSASASVDAFGTCNDAEDDASCPDDTECVEVIPEKESTGADLGCRCEEGFDEIDVPGVTKDGQAVTVCCGMENINLIIV